jgi:hypothetical protein
VLCFAVLLPRVLLSTSDHRKQRNHDRTQRLLTAPKQLQINICNFVTTNRLGDVSRIGSSQRGTPSKINPDEVPRTA